MATIANLNITLSANTAPLARGMKEAETIVKGFGTTLASGLAKARTAIMGYAAGILTIGTASHQFIESARRVDALSKASERLGVSAKNLQAIHFAMSLSNVAADQLDKTMLKMAGKLDAAAASGGPVADMVKALGLNLRELADASPDAAFAMIAESIADLADHGERAQAAMAIFEEEGLALINAFDGASESIDDSRKLLEQWGIALTDADARQVEAMNDSWTKMTTILSGIVDKFVTQIAPAVSAFLDMTMELLSPTKGVESGWEGIVSTIEFAMQGVMNLQSIVVGLHRILSSMYDGLFATLELGFNGLKAAHESLTGGVTAETQKAIDDSMRRMKQASDVFLRGVDDLGSGILGEAGTRFRDAADRVREEAKQTEEVVAKSKRLRLPDIKVDRESLNELKNVTSAFNKLSTPALEKGSAGAASAIADAQIKSLVPTAKGMAELKQGQLIHIEIAKEQLQAIKELQRKNAIEQGRL